MATHDPKREDRPEPVADDSSTRRLNTNEDDLNGRHAAGTPVEDARAIRHEVVAREKEAYGGIKFGSAFFGWLAATGLAVLLTALVAGAGAAVGLATPGDEVDAENAQTIGIVGGILLLVILFVSYYAGGYVAGRMARFNGAKQGLAVWLWAIIIAIVVAIIGAIAGAQFNVLANLDSFPRIPLGDELTTTGIITAVLTLLVSLGGAVLGGLGGMRFHRKVDKAGLGG